MKRMKISVIYLFALMALVMVGCSDDDNVNKKTDGEIEDLIIGTWKIIASEGYEINYMGTDKEQKEEWSENYTEDFTYFEFDVDGSGIEYSEGKNSYEESFTWTVKNKQIIIKEKYGDRIAYDIIELTSTKLVVEDKEDEDYYKKLTHVKVK